MKHHGRKIRFSIEEIAYFMSSSSIPTSKMAIVSNLAIFHITGEFPVTYPTFNLVSLWTSTGETQESMNNVSCRRDMTEILLKAT